MPLLEHNHSSIHLVQSSSTPCQDPNMSRFSNMYHYISTHSYNPKKTQLFLGLSILVPQNIISTPHLYTRITTNTFSAIVLSNNDRINVFHVRTIKITNMLVLHNVLCVLYFSFNIIFARRLG